MNPTGLKKFSFDSIVTAHFFLKLRPMTNCIANVAKFIHLQSHRCIKQQIKDTHINTYSQYNVEQQATSAQLKHKPAQNDNSATRLHVFWSNTVSDFISSISTASHTHHQHRFTSIQRVTSSAA